MKEPRYSKVKDLPIIIGVITKDRLEDLKKRLPGQPSNMDYRKSF